MNAKQISGIQERLLSLYLRLNGYFLSGLIVHSAEFGDNLTEIDTLGVRFPHSAEPEREVGPDPVLEVSSELIDLVICEVKGGAERPRFNDSLLEAGRLGSVLRWAGLYSEEEIDELAPELLKVLSPAKIVEPIIPAVLGPRKTRIRGLICCPDRKAPHRNQPWFIAGSAMLDYVSACLCPSGQRVSCSTKYDFGLWREYEPIVRYVKDRGPGNVGAMKDLYASFEAQ